MYTPSLLQSCLRSLKSRQGSQLVEAAVIMPIIILTSMLLLRTFTFYLEILSTGISEHMTALEASDEYRGAGVRRYNAEKDVKMLKGGMLRFDLTKKIKTRSYMINEDLLVRAGEMLD